MLPKGRGINSLTQTQAAPACAINQGLGFAIVHDNLHSWANRSPTILRFHARFSSDPWVVLAEGCRSRMTQIDCCLSGLREADAHDVRCAAVTGRRSRVIESMPKSKLSFATCAFHLP
jgi:hypothetical protein